MYVLCCKSKKNILIYLINLQWNAKNRYLDDCQVSVFDVPLAIFHSGNLKCSAFVIWETTPEIFHLSGG